MAEQTTHSPTDEEPIGVPVERLMHMAGTLDPEEARLMREAIEEACEQIDPETWDIELP